MRGTMTGALASGVRRAAQGVGRGRGRGHARRAHARLEQLLGLPPREGRVVEEVLVVRDARPAIGVRCSISPQRSVYVHESGALPLRGVLQARITACIAMLGASIGL